MDEAITSYNSVDSPQKVNYQKYPLFIVGGFIIFIIVFSIIFALILSKPAKKTSLPAEVVPSPISSNRSQPNSSKNSIKSLPTLIFKQYDNEGLGPVIYSSIKTYNLKANFTREEVKNFAKNLGLKTIVPTKGNNIVVANLIDKDKRGWVTFNTQSGYFSFNSFGSIKSSSYIPGQSVTSSAIGILKDINLWDDTLTCPITYVKAQKLKSVTFVECHRDWKKLSYPLINPMGILNIPEGNALSSLQPGKTFSYFPNDPNISGVTNLGILEPDQSGKSRPNDFNTVTVGIYPSGVIHSVVSTLRWIKNIDTYPAQDAISFKTALSLVSQNKATLALTLPSGKGSINWDKVYPNNKAISDKAQIKETALVYLEKFLDSPQPLYEPYYLFRGNTRLNTGYTVEFIQAVPALKSTLKSLNLITQEDNSPRKLVAGISTSAEEKNDSLQFKTFTPPTPSPLSPSPQSISPAPPTPTPTTSQPVTPQWCTPDPNWLKSYNSTEIGLEVPGYGTLVVNKIGLHGFGYASTSSEKRDENSVKNAFFKAVEEQVLIMVTKERMAARSDIPISTMKEFTEGTDTLRYKSIMSSVEARYQQAKAQNKLDEITKRPNLFPPDTVDHFSYIFGYADFELGASENSAALNQQLANLRNVCYLSGVSPSIFLYPKKDTLIKVTVTPFTSYTYPPAQQFSWDILGHLNGSINLNNATSYSSLYYEYDKTKVRFSESNSGIIIKRTEWKKEVKKISTSLKLTKEEENSMMSDAENALSSDINSLYLKVSLVETAELNKKLPLQIYPKPDTIHRIQILFSAKKSQTFLKPYTLTALPRNGFTVVEVGATISP